MVNVFIATIFCAVSFCFYKFSNQIICINRILSNMPKEIFEISVDLVNSNSDNAYFDQVKVINNVELYVEENIETYTKKYETKFVFLNSNDESICTNGLCDQVRIDFTAELNFSYQFERSVIYELWSRNK